MQVSPVYPEKIVAYEGADVALLGPVPFVAPAGAILTPRQAFAIELACDLVQRRDIAGAEQVVGRVQRELGISQDLHIAAVEAAALAANAPRARAARRLARLERNHALANIARDAAPLTDKNHRDILVAEQLRTKAKALRKARQRGLADDALTSAADLLRGVEADVHQRSEDRYIGRVTTETRMLEEDRGEVVATEEINQPAWRRRASGKMALVDGQPVLNDVPVKRLRITTRDGLEVLAKKSDDQVRAGDLPITAAAYAAGLRYRELYEKSDPERCLKAASWDDSARGPKHGGDNWEDARLGFARDVARIEDAVQKEGARIGGARLAVLWVKVLREVAGKGLPISRAVSGGRAREKWREAIDPVLDVVADWFGMQ